MADATTCTNPIRSDEMHGGRWQFHFHTDLDYIEPTTGNKRTIRKRSALLWPDDFRNDEKGLPGSISRAALTILGLDGVEDLQASLGPSGCYFGVLAPAMTRGDELFIQIIEIISRIPFKPRPVVV